MEKSLPKKSKDKILNGLLFDYWSTLDTRATTLDGMRAVRKRLATLRAEGGSKERIKAEVLTAKERHAEIKYLDRKIAQRKKLAMARMAQLKKKNPKASQSAQWEKLWSAYIKALADLDKPMKGANARAAQMRLGKAQEAIRKFDPDAYKRLIMGVRNAKQSKGKTALKTTGRAVKSAVSSVLGAGSQILGAGSKALANGKRRKNKTVIKKAKKVIVLNKGKKKAAKPKRNPSEWYELIEKMGPAQRTLKKSKSITTLEKERAKLSVERQGRTWIEDSKGNVVAGYRGHAGWRPNPKGKRNATTAKSPNRTARASRARTSSTGRKATKRKMARSRKAVAKRNPIEPLKEPIRFCTTCGKHLSKKQKACPKHPWSLVQKTPKPPKKNPSASEIRKKFAGSVNGSRELYFPKGTPAGQLAKLGRLVLIKTQHATIRPTRGAVWLCADTSGKLHLGSTTQAPMVAGPARNFGKVLRLEYESSKPHLGYGKPVVWFHRMGEEDGIRPTLHADSAGGLTFHGGAYRLTSRGIEN